MIRQAFYTCCLLFLFYHTVSAQGVSISPSRVFFEGTPGEVVKKKLLLANSGEKETFFQIHTKDWYRDTLGNKVFENAGTLSRSNAIWLDWEDPTISIKPKESKEVTLTMRIPAETPPDSLSNSMLFFTQFIPQDDSTTMDGKMGIRVLFEFGIHVYRKPLNGGEPDLLFTAFQEDVRTQNGISNARKVGIKVKNEGKGVCDARIALELTEKSSGEEYIQEPIGISLMPGEEQWVYFSVSPDIVGDFLGVAIAKMIGTTRTRVAEKNFVFQKL